MIVNIQAISGPTVLDADIRVLVRGEIVLERFEMRRLCSLGWEFSTKVFQILPTTKAQRGKAATKKSKTFSPRRSWFDYAHHGLRTRRFSWGALRAPVSLGISRAKNAKGAKERNGFLLRRSRRKRRVRMIETPNFVIFVSFVVRLNFLIEHDDLGVPVRKICASR